MVQFWREDLPHQEYVFFYIDVFGFSLRSGARPWYRGDQDDAIAREAFQVRHLTHTSCFITHLHGEGAEPLTNPDFLFAEREDPDLQRTGEPRVQRLHQEPEDRRQEHV